MMATWRQGLLLLAGLLLADREGVVGEEEGLGLEDNQESSDCNTGTGVQRTARGPQAVIEDQYVHTEVS
jgi:hypothetical protein